MKALATMKNDETSSSVVLGFDSKTGEICIDFGKGCHAMGPEFMAKDEAEALEKITYLWSSDKTFKIITDNEEQNSILRI